MRVKKILFISSLAMVMAVAQDTTGRQPNIGTETQNANDRSYAPRDVKILGDLDFGQESKTVEYSNSPKYRAFVFSAFGGQTVEIKVDGDSEQPFVALTDSCLKQLTQGTKDLTVSLPNRGPYIEVWYVVFRDTADKPAHFSVRVNKVAAPVETAMTATPPTQEQ